MTRVDVCCPCNPSVHLVQPAILTALHLAQVYLFARWLILSYSP